MPLTESQRLNRNKIFARGLEQVATTVVSLGAQLFRMTVNFIKELISTATGMGK